MNRFEIYLFGFRLTARGYAGILGAVIMMAMLLAYITGSLPYDLGWLPGDIWIDNLHKPGR